MEALCTLVIPLAVLTHLWVAPYTKVEESFNVQAVHDLLYHGFDLERYDHQEFPGVVPRTFLGALATAVTAAPFKYATEALALPKLANLATARLVLGLFASWTFVRVQQAVAKRFGRGTGACYGVLQASQFHTMFYASRFLPNTFAVIASNLALASLIRDEKGDARRVVQYLTCAGVIFRCDMVLLLAPASVALLLLRRMTLVGLVATGVVSSIASVVLTVAVDSVFWGRLLWPELEVFLFNNPAGDNRSSEWGVSSPHWYFTSALPRALSGSAFFVLIGALYERRIRPFGLIALAYVLLYSMLPHKEVRFLFPVLPYFNVVAATGLSRVFKMKGRKRLWLGFLSVGIIAVVLLHTYVAATVSCMNYPGGKAFEELHRMGLGAKDAKVSVHIDVFPAMTGVSRFGEDYEAWTYDKTPWDECQGEHTFDYLVTADAERPSYELVRQIDGYARFELPRDFSSLKEAVLSRGVPLVVVLSPKVYIHRIKQR
ncbi:Dol-P-Man:Man(7)GlcNAc(2)-PP-Dol alpha-1,6-mannosyltransferase [Chloropicon primus]|nr:Dol-P-Man:Man(7)GlcNAc(2)-PP-Dol alpha-1,6-mannosyltransferase [Chloropicon primus]